MRYLFDYLLPAIPARFRLAGLFAVLLLFALVVHVLLGFVRSIV